MTFSWPWALLSLLIIPIVVGVIWLVRRRRRRAAVRVTSIALVRAALPPRTRWTRLIPTLLLLLGFATLGVGAARPQTTVPVPSNSTTIMLAMDVSGSMCSTDVEPNRLTVAQKAAVSFIESQDGQTKIGLVAFAGVAGLQVPPTTDKDALIEAINNFTTARGTAIGSAILTSIDSIAAINPTVAPSGVDAESAQRSGYAADVIVVLTDRRRRGIARCGRRRALAVVEPGTRASLSLNRSMSVGLSWPSTEPGQQGSRSDQASSGRYRPEVDAMYDAPYELGSTADGYPVRIRARGRSVLSNPMLNRGTAFTPEQRQLLGVAGPAAQRRNHIEWPAAAGVRQVPTPTR